MLRLVDAPRCPYCARVRIMLAEKGVAHDPVVIEQADAELALAAEPVAVI